MRTILVLVITYLCHVFTHAQTTLTFDGVDDYTQTNYYNQLDLGTGNFALEAMISNLDFTISDTLTILSQQNTNSTQGICWSITNNTIHVQIEGIAYSMNHTFTGCTHLAVVRDNGELLFYANSTLLGTQSIAMTATSSCVNCDLLMGKTVDDSNYFKGTLDEVRIWNTNRSGTNISSYEITCLDSTAMTNLSLVGYWNFEENAGQFANNLGSIAHYTRLGNTFYSDNDDPTWTTTSCVSSTCYANGLASFILSDNDPKEADLVLLSNTSINSSVVYWSINGDTTLSVDSLQYAFPLGMNIIQLAVTSASGLSVRTVLLDVKRPKYPCGADEYTDWRRLNDRNYPRTRSLLYQAAAAARSGSSGKEYHIPVIFHVIADNQATLNAFPASRIQAQLDTLNKYFAKDSTGISFCLAQQPLSLTGNLITWSQFGSTVPGITYLLDTLDQYDFTNQTYVTRLMNELPFDVKEYLNIYIVDTIINPGSSFLGVASVGPNYGTFDGIGLDYDVFVGGAIGPMGKSLVHEVGHWLGLEHVFEPDGICDTYEQFHPTSDSGITNCSTPYSYGTSCPPNPVYNRGQNHMDYHSEPCLTVFTGGQIDRMHYILDNGRPYVHSEYNLIATRVQALGACVNKTNASAVFIASSESVCVGSTVELKGVAIPLSHWAWQISWDPNKNNGNPAPSTNGSCLSTSPSSGNSFSPPTTTLSICEPGIWDISLIINDTSRSTSIPIITIDTHSMSIEVLDCSPSDQRNRVTLSFDSTDWQINGATIDNLDAIPNDTTAGHIVSGTGYILNQNSEGVVMRTTVFGSPLWRRAIRIPNADVELFDVVSGVNYQGTDRIALAGRVKRGSTSELLLVIVDRAGNMLFQETYQMTKNGTQQANAVGLELIQFSNNDLAIVGFVGDVNVDNISADKRGFILGVNPTTGIQWEHYFESAKYTSTIDYDIAENVTEIVGDFGNGPKAAIVISGHSNRTQGTNTGSGTFISCLTISGGVVTEEWRKNVEFPSGVGSSKPVAVAYDNGRLFFVSFNSLLHGSLIIEIDPNTGDFGIEALIQDLYPVDLIIDGVNLILGGRNLSTDVLAAAKIPIPAVAATNFAPPSITVRTYSDTETKGDWGGLYNVSSYIKTPQSIVPSVNGGYMLIGEYAPNTISANNFNDIGLVFNKIDDELITTCMAGGSYTTSLSNFTFGYITHADSTQLTTSLGIDTISCDSLITTCYQLGCLTPSYTLNSFHFSKCPLDSVILVGSFSEIGNFSYQWSPSTNLSSDTVLTPTTTTPTDQTYNLIITDNTTGCQVAEANYIVTIPIYTSVYNVPCLGLDTNLYTYNTITNENEINLSYLLASENIPQGGNWITPFTINSFIDTIGDDILHFSGPLDSFSEIHYRFGDCDDRVAIFYLGLSGNILGSSSQTICSGETITFQGVNGVGWTHQWIVIPPGLPPFVAGTGPNLTYTFNFNSLLSTGTHGYLVYHRVSQPCAIDSLLYSTPPNFSNFEEVYVGVYNSAVNINLDTCTGVLHLTGNRPGENIQWYDAITGLAILGETTENYNPATSGSYYATVRNPQCDLISDTFNYMPLLHISSTATVNSNYNGADISCFGASDGAAMVTISNGLSPYTYLWSNGDTLATATGLAVGNYQMTVIDACMDTTIASVTLTEPTALTISVDTIIAASCFSVGDGSATVVGSGGTGTYTYLWSNTQTGAIAVNLTAGTYTVTVTDSNGCSVSTTVNITEPNVLNATLTNTSPVSCVGQSDGEITANTTGGTAPYAYLWSNSASTNIITNLSTGTYIVTITDANNCTYVDSITLTVPPLPIIATTITNVSCNGLADGEISTSITGVTAPYTYLWSDTQTGATAVNLTTGTYTVTVTDNNGCSVSTTVNITEPNVLNATLTNTSPVSCVGQSDGEITANATGGTAPYTYLWSNSASTNIITNLSTGTYIVTITDANNCTYVDSITLTVPPLPIIATTITDVSCNGLADGEISTSITGVTAPYTYLWSDAQTGATAVNLTAGTYTVTVTDNNGCSVSTTASVTEPTILSTTLDSTNVNCIIANSGTIDNTPTGGTIPYTYLWSNGATSQDVNGLVAGNYCVTVTDANNCTFVACTNIEPLITPFSIVKLVDKDTIVPYDTVCYSILVTNNCQSAKDVVVTDTLPTGLLVTTVGSFIYDNLTNVLIDTLVIGAGETDTLQFKVRVLKMARCGNMASILNQANAFELGSPTPIVSDDVAIWIQDTFATNCAPLLDTVYFSDLISTGELLSATAALSNSQTRNVAGVWIVDVGLSYSFTNNSILEMNPGTQIIVSPGASLTFDNATVRAACNNCLWQSILVQNDGTLATEKAVLRDAQYAIHAENNAVLQYITNTDFLDNFIGIYVAPNTSNNLTIGPFEKNTFSAPSILPPFLGLQGTPTLDVSGNQLNVNPNATGGTGLSGILGWDLLALNLNLATPTLSNNFQRLVSGIVLFNTNFSTNSCSFNTIEQNTIYPSNLAYQGCGIHVQSPLVLDFKEALIEDCSFEKCFIGISGISAGMRIYRNQMDEIVDMGVRSTRLFNTVLHVRFNNFVKMERLGVAAFDPRIPSDIWIDNNTINMTTVSGEGTCIFINDNPTGDASSLVISNNTLDANEAENGIAVLNHENSNDPRFAGLVQGNTITMRRNSPERAGILAANSRLHVECNTITGDANGQTLNAPNTFGIVAAGGTLGGVSTYQCNNVTLTNRGVFFEGFNNQVVFRGNSFDRHDIGLLMDGGSIIGDQFDNQEYYGNTWTGGANSDVFHNGNGFIQSLSFFNVNSNPNLDFRPHNYGQFLSWFNDNSNFPNFDCVEPFNYCGNSRSNRTNSRSNRNSRLRITRLDRIFARNRLRNIPLVTKYNGKRALFKKLVNNPSLGANSRNPRIQNFVTNHQNTCIGHFDNVATQCKQAFTMNSIDSVLLDSCKNTCWVYLDSLHYLDSILAINFNSTIAATRNGMANNLSRVIQQQQVLLNNIETQQQVVLTPICASNNSFNTIILHEVLEKEVNDIYLNTLAKGILEFSSSELTSLRQIAGHCPQEGGAAVHQARGMLSMVEDVNLLNFDCVTNNGRFSVIEEGNKTEVTTDIEAWNLILYPNPASRSITLESNLLLEDEIQIEIYNALGQKVKEISVNEDIHIIDINVSTLLDGIYNIRLQSGNHKITKSFVVVK